MLAASICHNKFATTCGILICILAYGFLFVDPASADGVARPSGHADQALKWHESGDYRGAFAGPAGMPMSCARLRPSKA